jgi:hypothetical protein
MDKPTWIGFMTIAIERRRSSGRTTTARRWARAPVTTTSAAVWVGTFSPVSGEQVRKDNVADVVDFLAAGQGTRRLLYTALTRTMNKGWICCYKRPQPRGGRRDFLIEDMGRKQPKLMKNDDLYGVRAVLRRR